MVSAAMSALMKEGRCCSLTNFGVTVAFTEKHLAKSIRLHTYFAKFSSLSQLESAADIYKHANGRGTLVSG